MTTERKPQRIGATEWRLYAVAVIAAVYVIAWRGVTAVEPPRSVPPAAPVAQRPRLAPPPGWRVASRSEAASPVVRAPVQRPLRVRTRSS